MKWCIHNVLKRFKHINEAYVLSVTFVMFSLPSKSIHWLLLEATRE